VTAVLDLAALVTTAFGLVAAAVVLAAARRPMPALAVLLDFLTAAGLLRLAGEPSWDTIAAAAAVIAVRRLVATGLRASHPH
jgi:predicted NAD/FAD-binding protein